MSYKRTSIRGTLSFDCRFDIEEGEPRPVQYGSNGARYQVETLAFSLMSEALDDSKHPRYKDLKVSAMTLSGHKLKRDGTPGSVVTKEKFFCWGTRWPTWIDAIVTETVQELRGTRPVGGQ